MKKNGGKIGEKKLFGKTQFDVGGKIDGKTQPNNILSDMGRCKLGHLQGILVKALFIRLPGVTYYLTCVEHTNSKTCFKGPKIVLCTLRKE